jgi:hypothetical protein
VAVVVPVVVLAPEPPEPVVLLLPSPQPEAAPRTSKDRREAIEG